MKKWQNKQQKNDGKWQRNITKYHYSNEFVDSTELLLLN